MAERAASAIVPIPFSRPCLGQAEADGAAAAVATGWIVGGPRLAEFEALVAARCGAAHAVGVSSWTTGAFLVLKCLGIGPGDEVIVPSLTFIASVNVVSHAGATPVFIDVDPQTYNLDPAQLEALITPRTRAILAVDQLGLPCEIDQITAIADRHGLKVIQDAACSLGSLFRGRPTGSQAPISVFSLHARKVVTTGEGGVILTHDMLFAEKLRRQRHQGMSLSDYQRHAASPTTFESYPEIGFNFRITDIQAAIGVAQMHRLEAMLERRRALAARYSSALAASGLLMPPYFPTHVVPNWQSYQVRLRPGCPLTRNEVMDRLYDKGVATRRGVMASHLEPAYASVRCDLPATEVVARETLQLPLFVDLSFEDQDRVIDAILNLA